MAEWDSTEGAWVFIDVPDGAIVYVVDSGTTVQVIGGVPAPFDLGFGAATFITADDETATLANSLKLVAGSNVTFDTSTPGELKISASGGGGGGTVESVIGTTNEIDVDSSDPANPVVSLANAVRVSLALADSAVQPGDLADVAFSGDYSSLSGIPSTFPPSAHTHGDSEITSLAWSKLTGVPATFTPSAHTHSASDINVGTLADARLSSNIPRLNATALITGAWTFDSNDNSTPLAVRRSPSNAAQYTGVFGTTVGNFVTSYSATTDTKHLYLRATTNEAGAAGTQEPEVIVRGRANTDIARFSDTRILLNRPSDFASGAYVRFGHAQQYDGNDGKIGVGLFESGLNIVGVQTVAGQGRRINIWGSIYLNDGARLYDEDGTAYLKSNYPSGNVTISTSAPSGGNDGDIWLQVL